MEETTDLQSTAEKENDTTAFHSDLRREKLAYQYVAMIKRRKVLFTHKVRFTRKGLQQTPV